MVELRDGAAVLVVVNLVLPPGHALQYVAGGAGQRVGGAPPDCPRQMRLECKEPFHLSTLLDEMCRLEYLGRPGEDRTDKETDS